MSDTSDNFLEGDLGDDFQNEGVQESSMNEMMVPTDFAQKPKKKGKI